ncbi:919_t:CDS:2, partial [Acaulospora colombiana]
SSSTPTRQYLPFAFPLAALSPSARVKAVQRETSPDLSELTVSPSSAQVPLIARIDYVLDYSTWGGLSRHPQPPDSLVPRI